MKLNRVDHWVQRWQIPGSKPGVFWTVAINNKGEFGCSCPVWKFKRKECKHIRRIKWQLSIEEHGLRVQRGEVQNREVSEEEMRHSRIVHTHRGAPAHRRENIVGIEKVVTLLAKTYSELKGKKATEETGYIMAQKASRRFNFDE